MKLFLILSVLLLSAPLKKIQVAGEYENHFGYKLSLHPDSTFDYRSALSKEWCKGKWTMEEDTLYFAIIPVYDTLRLAGQKDTLLLSFGETPRLLTGADTYNRNKTHRQRLAMYPKLYFKNNRLYPVDSTGKIDQTRMTAIVTNPRTKKTSFKKYPLWFEKK